MNTLIETPIMYDNVYTTLLIAPQGEPLPEGAEVAPSVDETVLFGSTWDPISETWVPPEKLKKRVGEFRDFMKFFTKDEQIKIVGATITNTEIKLWYDNAMGGAAFSLDHPETVIGLSALVSAQLLTRERADEILDGDFNNLPTF